MAIEAEKMTLLLLLMVIVIMFHEGSNVDGADGADDGGNGDDSCNVGVFDDCGVVMMMKCDIVDVNCDPYDDVRHDAGVGAFIRSKLIDLTPVISLGLPYVQKQDTRPIQIGETSPLIHIFVSNIPGLKHDNGPIE